MKKILSNQSDVVTLVTIPHQLPILMQPHVGEYYNPYISRTLPCERKEEKLFDLVSGKEVEKTEGMIEWKNLSGTVFSYPDGQMILLSRLFTGEYLLLSITPQEFHQETMILRPIITGAKKKMR